MNDQANKIEGKSCRKVSHGLEKQSSKVNIKANMYNDPKNKVKIDE